MRPAIASALVVIATVATLATTVQSAQALTIRDVIELTRAGLKDEVLVALIEVDGGVYPTDTATLKSLKEAGVSDRVMIALIRSGRDRRVEEPPPVPVVDDAQLETPPPPTVVVEHRGVVEHREPQVQQVAVPVYVPVYPTRGRQHRRDEFIGIQESTFVPFQPGVVRPRQEQKSEPVYWGFGGKLRPDAWGQPQDRDRKPSDDGDKDKDKDKGERNRPPKK
jgi:hypothetical protein